MDDVGTGMCEEDGGIIAFADFMDEVIGGSLTSFAEGYVFSDGRHV